MLQPHTAQGTPFPYHCNTVGFFISHLVGMGWTIDLNRLCLVPSHHLHCLRSRRRRTRDPHLRKELNLQIRFFLRRGGPSHIKDLGQWKSERLSRFLASWKLDGNSTFLASKCWPHWCPSPSSKWLCLHVRKNCKGDTTIRRLKHDKRRDEVGLLTELLKHAPREFSDALLRLYNDLFYTGEPPVFFFFVFFSSHLFARVGSGWSCFTGQLPGMCHLYTGGSGCAGTQGQVQAAAP